MTVEEFEDFLVTLFKNPINLTPVKDLYEDIHFFESPIEFKDTSAEKTILDAVPVRSNFEFLNV